MPPEPAVLAATMAMAEQAAVVDSVAAPRAQVVINPRMVQMARQVQPVARVVAAQTGQAATLETQVATPELNAAVAAAEVAVSFRCVTLVRVLIGISAAVSIPMETVWAARS